jgi:hypothetical protein
MSQEPSLLKRLWSKRWFQIIVAIWGIGALAQCVAPLGSVSRQPDLGAQQDAAIAKSRAAANDSGPVSRSSALKTCDGEPSNRRMRPLSAEVAVRVGPSSKAERLLNARATQAFGRNEFVNLDPSELLSETCRNNGWSFVQILEPDHLTEFKGWVKTSQLRALTVDPRGIESFDSSSFQWTSKTKRHASVIVTGVNQIQRQNPNCTQIDTGSVDISTSKGTPANPVFYVTCRNGDKPFNVFFSKSQVEGGKDLSGRHIDHPAAVNACEAYAKSHAMNPSTVDFSRAYALKIIDFPNGRTKVQSTFTAASKLGVTSKYWIDCTFDANGLMDAVVDESR